MMMKQHVSFASSRTCVKNTKDTVNPQISPWGLICKNEFLGGGLFEGGAYFKIWHFPQRLTYKTT